MAHAWRLTFAYDGDEFTLKSARRLVKRVPPSQAIQTKNVGRFIELRDPNRKAIYRRSITELIPDTVEYPTGDPARPLGRVQAPRRGEVSLLVPALPEGRSVAIVVAGRLSSAGERATQASIEVTSPRDLIAVDLPREGEVR
jgi:hypothetical protein